MKTIFFALMALAISSKSFSQERWTVELNSKVLLSAKAEDETANVVAVKDLKKGSLLVTYVPGQVEGERKRRLMIYDSGDNELYSKEAFNISVPVATLKKWRLNTTQIKIYTVPVLDAGGATVKLRRVHLCTINFE